MHSTFGRAAVALTAAVSFALSVPLAFAGVPTTTTSSTTSTTTSTTSTSTTTSSTSTTTTLPPPSTSSTTTTLDLASTTTTSTIPTGACCAFGGCTDETLSTCNGLLGTYQGDGSSCTEPLICVDCGSGCVDFGEECDDGNTMIGDGCDAGCQEEDCFVCEEILGFTRGSPVPSDGCDGPSICEPEISEACEVCGDEDVGPGEECDDGNTASGDCCSPTCQFDAAGAPCPDEVFCDGIETCDGEGSCQPAEAPADCSFLDGECSEGVCEVEEDQCVADTASFEGDPCEATGTCTVEGSGVCTDGECVGQGTTLSPSCRWIVVGGSPDGPVRVRSGRGSMLDASTCGDTSKLAGITSASHVVTADMGEGIRYYGPVEVAGDIVTGGASVGTNLYAKVPGTNLKTVAGGMTVMKVPAGVVDTTGSHPLVEVCVDDKAALATAMTALDGMAATLPPGGSFKVPVGASATIDITGMGVEVIDMQNLKVSHGATLALKGTATDVLMIRVTDGPLKIGYGANVVLDGLIPQNVLFYSQWLRCRLSPGVVGAGTVFCPEAGRFVIGVGTTWTGTFLGGAREVQVRLGADLTHAPFTGF